MEARSGGMSASMALCLHAASSRCCVCCPAADRQIIVPETSESPQSRKRTWRSPKSLPTAAGFFTLSRAQQEPPPFPLTESSAFRNVRMWLRAGQDIEQVSLPPSGERSSLRLLRGHRRLSEGEPDVETPRGSPSAPAPPLTSSVPTAGLRRRLAEAEEDGGKGGAGR